MKCSDLYLHHYKHQDHLDIAKRVRRIRSKNWVVSYDHAPQIMPMYVDFRSIVYGASYSAQDRYKGSEVMFFSDRLNIPETVAPMHLAA